jgi:hypothetical protein
MFFVTLSILFGLWGNLEVNGFILYCYYSISSLGGVTLAFWISMEERRLENYATKVRILEDRLTYMEEKIRIIRDKSKVKI